MALTIARPDPAPLVAPGLYESTIVASATNESGDAFSITLGLSEAVVAKLKARALDESDAELVTNTSDRRRFGEGSYEAWFAKGRVPIALLDTKGELAAIIWFGTEAPPEEAHLEGAWDTIAFRSYPPYRGKGIMGDFSRFALSLHDALRPSTKIWLETNTDNEAGIRLYEKLGFVRHSEEKRVLMVRE